MDSVPKDMSEEAVAEWLKSLAMQLGKRTWKRQARAVLALVERERAKERALVRTKVREAARLARDGYYIQGYYDNGGFIGVNRVMLPSDNAVVARVLGEGEEAPRG